MKILVNATALDSRGAFSVANSFASEMFQKTELLKEMGIELVLLSAREELKMFENSRIKIEFTPYPKKSLYHKWKYEKYILPEKIKKERYEAYLSLQNYSLKNIKGLKQFVLIHQPIPFSKLTFNELEIGHRIKYKFILDKILKKQKHISGIFVQTKWMKDEIKKKYSFNCPILVIKPPPNEIRKNLKEPDEDLKIILSSETVKLFYPTNNERYKNNKRLIEVVEQYNNNSHKKILLLITIKGKSTEYIKYIGNIPYESIGYVYSKSDALIFPSLTETLGFPLLEAQEFNLPVLASDLPYARELCEEKAIYFNPRDTDSMVEAISRFNQDWKKQVKAAYNSKKINNNSYMEYIYFIKDEVEKI